MPSPAWRAGECKSDQPGSAAGAQGRPAATAFDVDPGAPGATAKVRAVRRESRPSAAGRSVHEGLTPHRPWTGGSCRGPHQGSGCRSKRVIPAGADGPFVDRGFQPSGIVQRARGGPPAELGGGFWCERPSCPLLRASKAGRTLPCLTFLGPVAPPSHHGHRGVRARAIGCAILTRPVRPV